MKYIDTHTHIYAQEFREDIDDVMERALLAGMWKAVLPATDEASAEEAVALASRYPGVLYPVLGLHPERHIRNSRRCFTLMPVTGV